MAIAVTRARKACPEDRSTLRQALSLFTDYMVAGLFKLFVIRSQDTWDVRKRPGAVLIRPANPASAKGPIDIATYLRGVSCTPRAHFIRIRPRRTGAYLGRRKA